MRSSRYSEEQIIGISREVDAGRTVSDVVRKHGISEQAYCRWKANGRRLRTLNIVDGYSRERLAIEVDTSLPGQRVVRVLEPLATRHGPPRSLARDNGPEFVGQALDQWAYKRGVELRFITPGRPIENGTVESFNGRFRDECLNQYWFRNLDDEHQKTKR